MRGSVYPEVDRAVRLLGASRRRSILAELDRSNSPLSLEALARGVVSRERGVGPAEVPEKSLRDAMISLHHVHLPMLDEAGLLEYDQSSLAVTSWDHPNLGRGWLGADGVSELAEWLSS